MTQKRYEKHENATEPMLAPLPHSPRMEAAMLSCCMLDDDGRVVSEAINSGISQESFYAGAHAMIWNCIAELNKEGMPTTLDSIVGTLELEGKIENVGGLLYLVKVMNVCDTPSSHKQYIKSLIEHEQRRKLIRKCKEVEEQLKNGETETSDVLTEFEKTLIGFREKEVVNIKNAKELFSRTRENINNPKEKGIMTGYASLDKILGGLKAGQLILLGGRPGEGKTSLGINVADNIAASGVPVGFFQLEMMDEEMSKRFVSSRARMAMRSIESMRNNPVAVNDRINHAFDELEKLELYIDDTAGITVEQLRARAILMKLRHKIRVLFIDYLQLLGTSERGLRRNEQIGIVSRTLKRLAKELKLPVVGMVQINREVEKDGRAPRLSDLKESGDLEQDADVVVLIHPKRNTEHPESKDVDLIIAKQRNGPAGSNIVAPVIYEKSYVRFIDKRVHEDRMNQTGQQQPLAHQQREHEQDRGSFLEDDD